MAPRPAVQLPEARLDTGGFEGSGFAAVLFFGTPVRSANWRVISSISFCALRTSWARSWEVRDALFKPAPRRVRVSFGVTPNCLETSDSPLGPRGSVVRRV